MIPFSPTPVFPLSSHPCTNSYKAKYQATGYMYLPKESDSQFSQASCGTHLYVMLAANLLLLLLIEELRDHIIVVDKAKELGPLSPC